MAKGPEAFRTISEVAEELELPQHVLRFWETRFSQIKPLKRGGGRRYYRPDDIDLLRGIRHLLYGEGYTIRGVQRILREQGPRFAAATGRGEIRAPAKRRPAEDDDEEGDDGLTVDAADAAAGPIEPHFDPRAFRPTRSDGGDNDQGGRPSIRPLTGEEVRRLQSTLTELLELKRLLDQSR